MSITIRASSPPEPTTVFRCVPRRQHITGRKQPPKIVPPSSCTRSSCPPLVRRRCSHGYWSDTCCSHETSSQNLFFFLSKVINVCSHLSPSASAVCFRQQDIRAPTLEAIRASSRSSYSGLMVYFNLASHSFRSPNPASLI